MPVRRGCARVEDGVILGAMRATRDWPLLLPVAYLLHLTEEAAGGFVGWAAAHLSPGFTHERFVAINAVAVPLAFAAALASMFIPAARWLAVTLAVLFLLNGLIHLGSSLATGGYAPGVVTGVVLYLPLGVFALRRLSREVTPRMMGIGVAAGIAVHALVAVLAFLMP